MDLLVPKERLVCWFPVQIEAKIIKKSAAKNSHLLLSPLFNVQEHHH